MIFWCILGCLSFSAMVIVIARQFVIHYCDEISNILNQIISKNTVIDTYGNCGSRMSKMVHQANKIIDMMEQDCGKSKEENEEVKRLIANLSHQLKTPLSNMIMYNDMLVAKQLPIEKQNEFLLKLKYETSKMDWLIKTLFKMARLEVGAIDFKVDDILIKETITQSISAVFGQAYEKNIIIEMKAFGDKILRHNRKWTAEAITNILENAVKYSNSGSTISIGLEEREIYSRIVIQDQGIGIERKDFNNIFKRFYRGENVQDLEGAGIGLYLARLIIIKENGNITVQSELNKGSCFSIFLQNIKK